MLSQWNGHGSDVSNLSSHSMPSWNIQTLPCYLTITTLLMHTIDSFHWWFPPDGLSLYSVLHHMFRLPQGATLHPFNHSCNLWKPQMFTNSSKQTQHSKHLTTYFMLNFFFLIHWERYKLSLDTWNTMMKECFQVVSKQDEVNKYWHTYLKPGSVKQYCLLSCIFLCIFS